MIQTNDTQPIFIVGVPRSGTTLLAAMLAAHSRLSCGPETRFFRFLARTDSRQLCEKWPENAVDFLFSVMLEYEPVPDHYDLSRNDIRNYLGSQQPGIPVILMALTEQFMDRESKRRWVEKSPEHLMSIHEVRRYYPRAPIIRIIRDPRDVALSMNRMPTQPQDYFDALLHWRKYDEESRSFFETDENSFSLYYENLILDPEQELKQLCDFIGEEYESQMLNTSASAPRVVTAGEFWKSLVQQPVDKSRIHVWKRDLDADQNRMAEALVGDRLAAYDYECVTPWDKIALVYPSLETVLRYRDSLETLSRGNIQLRLNAENSDLTVFAGNPDRDRWLGYQNPERWLNMLNIFAEIARRKFARQPVVWVGDDVDQVGHGWSSRLVAFVLRIAAQQQLPGDYLRGVNEIALNQLKKS